MKRLVLITAVLLFAKSFCGDLYAQMSEEEHLKSILEPDTVFVVYLEADTLPRGYTVFLVFENITGDSILLFSNFKLYRYGFAPGWGRGFAMNFYLNGGDKPLMPNWGQWDEEVFKFSDDKHDEYVKKRKKNLYQPAYFGKQLILETGDPEVPVYPCQGLKFQIKEGIVISILIDFRTDGDFD